MSDKLAVNTLPTFAIIICDDVLSQIDRARERDLSKHDICQLLDEIARGIESLNAQAKVAALEVDASP